MNIINDQSGHGQERQEWAVEVTNVGKCFHIYNHPRDRLIQSLWGRDKRGKPKKYYREFWALQEISFRLARGQTLGIVGRNGSGKSTLLQLICGTLKPTHGDIRVGGRIGALLELGSGFNPEFSGLENIYFNAALLGLSKSETDEKIDKILAFADIGDFISQPVKTYSSGMAVRLAFAVQAHVDPQILVVDEALAVGDELFQKKCYSHLEKMKDKGTSILLVTHSSFQITQHCDKALLINKGKAKMLGAPTKVIVFYQRILNSGGIDEVNDALSDTNAELVFNQESKRANPGMPRDSLVSLQALNGTSLTTGDGKVAFFDPNLKPQSTELYPCLGGKIMDISINISSEPRVNVIPFGEDFELEFEYEALADLRDVATSCFIANHTGRGITGHTYPENMESTGSGKIPYIPQGARWKVRYGFHGCLWPGVYLISGALLSFEDGNKKFVHRVIDFRAFRILENPCVHPLGACSLKKSDAELIKDF